MNNVLINVLSNKLATHFGIDTTSAIVLLSSVSSIKPDSLYDYALKYSYYLIFLIPIIILYFIRGKFPHGLSKKYNTSRFTINNQHAITLLKYLTATKLIKTPIETIEHITDSGDTVHYFTPGKTVTYYDTNQKVHCIIWTVIEVTKVTSLKGVTSEIKTTYMWLSVEYPNTITDYLNAVGKYYTNYEENETSVDLYHYHLVVSKDNPVLQYIRNPLYKGERTNDNYDQYVRTYFSKVMNGVWDNAYAIAKTPRLITQHGQPARCGYLFHGPPGTGKSTIVLRLAMALHRNVITVDPSVFLYAEKKYIYAFVNGGYILPANKVVMGFDEFDRVVMQLKEREKEKEPTEVKKDAKEDKSDNGFRVKDLLELFQGPIPTSGSIMIATSNCYDELVQICPQLFRDGRLTAVECKNLEWSELQHLTKHYFGRELDIPEKPINMPTSKIATTATNIALKNIPTDEKFRMFQEFVQQQFDKS